VTNGLVEVDAWHQHLHRTSDCTYQLCQQDTAMCLAATHTQDSRWTVCTHEWV